MNRFDSKDEAVKNQEMLKETSMIYTDKMNNIDLSKGNIFIKGGDGRKITEIYLGEILHYRRIHCLRGEGFYGGYGSLEDIASPRS